MKRLLGILLTIAMLVMCFGTIAENGAAHITFEDETYDLTYEGAEIIDGQLVVNVGGYGNTMQMRGGSIVVVARAQAVVGGETLSANSITANASGVFNFGFDTDQLPEAVLLAPYEDPENPVVLWEAEETPQDAETENAVPAEIVGSWSGVGTPKNGGAAIDLNLTVNEDGSGEYTFDQGSYHESYPFTVSAADNTFSVDIPATSMLGSVSGTWALENGKLYLDITSVFTSGGSYSYTAECEKVTDEVAEQEADEAQEDAADDVEYSDRYDVGKTITFGSYGGEEIEWLILDADGPDRVMITVKAQDAVCFNENTEDGSEWESSHVRAWLNDTFYSEAFSPEEQERLAEGVTGDKVYLLSVDEANAYFPNNEDRICYPTQKAMEDGAWKTYENKCWWWLRTSGLYDGRAAGVAADGNINCDGNFVTKADDCVRPVVVLRLTEADTAAQTDIEEETSEEEISEDIGGSLLEDEVLEWWERLDSDELQSAGNETAYAGRLLIVISDYNYSNMEVIEREEDGSWRGIPGEMLADSLEDADTLIFIVAERVTVGYYSLGGAAQKTTTMIYAIDLHSGRIIPELTAATRNPPQTITVQTINGVAMSNGASGAFELGVAAEEILARHTDEIPEPTAEPVIEEDEPDGPEAPQSEEDAPVYADGEDAEFFLAVLDEDVYRETYDALLGGEVIQNGSKGSTARGVQQTLIALGQGISADGAVGKKTMEALNNVQRVFGAAETETLDAAGYAELLKWLVFATDEDAAYEWMRDENEGEYMYLRACVLELNGYSYHAAELFRDCEWADGAERAEACVQPMPKNGEIWRSSSFKGSKSSLTFKVNSTSEESGSLFKIYNEDEELLSCVFVNGSGSGKLKLSGGTYIIKMGTGSEWYGMGDSFGEDGWYETMLFDGGEDRVTLSNGYDYTLTINTTEGSGDSVGSEDEEWSDF